MPQRRYNYAVRGKTRIRQLMARNRALDNMPIRSQTAAGFDAGYGGLMRRRNALRGTARSMIRSFMMNPQGARMGSRYR